MSVGGKKAPSLSDGEDASQVYKCRFDNTSSLTVRAQGSGPANIPASAGIQVLTRDISEGG